MNALTTGVPPTHEADLGARGEACNGAFMHLDAVSRDAFAPAARSCAEGRRPASRQCDLCDADIGADTEDVSHGASASACPGLQVAGAE
jgi:hypothetical protein